MPENAEVFRVTHLGIETTPGTAVPGIKRLGATGVVPRPRIPTQPFRPMGSKVPTVMIREKEHTEATINGRMAYNDLLYLYSSILTKVAPTTPATPAQAILTRRWAMEMNNFGPDTPQTFTVENGSSVNATQFTFGVVNSLQVRMTEVETATTGQMLGTITTEPFAITTAGVTDVPVVEIGPMDVDVFVGTSANTTTQLDRPLETEISIADRFQMLRTLDRRNRSVTAFYERPPTLTARLLMEHDAVSQTFLDDLRAATTRYMKIQCTGRDIEVIGGVTHFPYQITWLFPFKFGEPNIGGRNDLWTSDWTVQPIYDTVAGHGMIVTIDTAVAAL